MIFYRKIQEEDAFLERHWWGRKTHNKSEREWQTRCSAGADMKGNRKEKTKVGSCRSLQKEKLRV